MNKIFFFCLCLALTSAAPTSTSFKKVVSESVDDVKNLLAAKAAVAQYTGEAVGEAAIAAGNAAVEAVSSIDPIQLTDDLEASIIDSKVNSIKAVFEAKRALLNAMAEARKAHAAQLSAFFNATVENVGSALDATADGISVTKEVVADFAEEITFENAQNALVTAFNQANVAIQQTVEGLLNAVVETKQMMAEGAANFDSKSSLRGTKASIGTALKATTSSAEELADKLGFFAAIDGMVQGIANLPTKVKDSLAGKVEEMMEDEEAVEAAAANEDMAMVKEPKVDVQVTVNGDVDLDNFDLESVIKEEVETRIAEARGNMDILVVKDLDEEMNEAVAEVKEIKEEIVEKTSDNFDDGLEVEKFVVETDEQ